MSRRSSTVGSPAILTASELFTDIFREKTAAAREVLKRIADGNPVSPSSLEPEAAKVLEAALSLVEMRCIELGMPQHAGSNKSMEFRDCCSLAFDVMRVLFAGRTGDGRVKAALRVVAAGILAGRTADARRYLDEHGWPVPEVDPEKSPWAEVVFFRIADGFLRIAGRKNPEDLDSVCETIAWLRANQERYEPEYLQQADGSPQVAVFELVALYHLARVIEILATCLRKGAPHTSEDDIDSHVSRAIRAACFAGLFDFEQLLRLVGMASVQMVRSAFVLHE